MAKYLEIMFRQRLRFAALLLLPVVLGVSVAVVFASFRATATLRIEDPAAFGTTFVPVGWSPNQTPAQNLADSVSQVVKTPAFAHSLSDRLTSAGPVASGAELQQTLKSSGTSLRAVASGPHLLTLPHACPPAASWRPALPPAIDS